MNSSKRLFNCIVGYNDIKQLIRQAVYSDANVHWLFYGPPASAKSLFLLEMEKEIPKTIFVTGSRISKKGLHSVLLEHKPHFLLFDEIDKAPRTASSALLSLMEMRRIIITLGKKSINTELHTKVFASCNNIHRLPPELLSRFQKLYFPPYTKDEFLEICSGYVVHYEKVREEVALRAGELVWESLNRDIRQVIRIVRLSKTVEQVEQTVEVFKKYAGGATQE
jgi:MoxR-like ATPase